jgi:hypothetical protein
VFGGGIDMTKDEALKLALEALESIEWHGAGSCWVLDDEKVESAEAALREAVAQPEERNFCPRCGKRTADPTTVHTCTPPQEKT